MSEFTSKFASAIDAMLDYRVALGLSDTVLKNRLWNFDRYCAEHHPDVNTMTKSLVFAWLNSKGESKSNSASNDARAIRQFAEYLNAIGQEAYVLPQGFYSFKSTFMPYVFTDNELTALFRAADSLGDYGNPTEAAVAPVLFRLIYTCGLRPNEGRNLEHKNVDFNTGEVYVTNTKKKRDRTVVMSGDMRTLCANYFHSGKRPESRYLFPRQDGQAYSNAQMDRLLKKCWSLANPGVADLPSVRTYDLRHRFASARLNRWLDEGADLNNKLPYLRAYMGHKELSETAYYIHILPENLVKSAGINWAALNALLPEVTAWEN